MSRIEELEKRLAADPNSRIFVQLAEEYRKQGLFENAIEICEEGLKKHAHYPSARVALGRSLLQAESFDRACTEFETVLAEAPDNILANKFLGETYHRLGRLDEAVQKYQIAQSLAPEDTEIEEKIRAVMTDMEGGGASAPSDEVDLLDVTAPASPEEMTGPPLPPQPQAIPSASSSAFAHAPPSEPTLVDGVPPQLDQAATEPTLPAQGGEESPFEAAPEEAAQPEEQEPSPIPLVDVDEPMVLEGSAYARAGELPPEAQPVPEEPPPTPPDVISPFEAVTEREQAFEEPVSESERVFEAPLVDMAPPATPSPPEVVADEPAPTDPQLSPPPPAAPEQIETPTMAELYASQGHFDRAVAVYRNLLARSPNERQYLERIEELQMLALAGAASRNQGANIVPGDDLSDESRQRTIDVLEQWLDAIRTSRRN